MKAARVNYRPVVDNTLERTKKILRIVHDNLHRVTQHNTVSGWGKLVITLDDLTITFFKERKNKASVPDLKLRIDVKGNAAGFKVPEKNNGEPRTKEQLDVAIQWNELFRAAKVQAKIAKSDEDIAAEDDWLDEILGS